MDPETIELASPAFGHSDVRDDEADLTIHHAGEPLGERIVVHGKVVDGAGRQVRNQLIEVWQAKAAGRYVHKRDQHPAPLDPNFTGTGRMITGEDGSYSLVTIKPGPYPWRNHRNAWRPAHIHFSAQRGTGVALVAICIGVGQGSPSCSSDPEQTGASRC